MRYIPLLVLLVLICACSRLPEARDLPFIHKIDIQQGNVVTQDMLAQLRPQMDKKKVLFIMGSPVIQDTFNNTRWDYLYTFEPGGGQVERRLITLHFVDDKLDHVSGDVTPSQAPLVATLHHDTTVNVPKYQKKGIISKLKDTMPFTDKEQAATEDDADGDADADADANADADADAAAEAGEAEKDAAPPVDDTPPPRSPYADLQAGPGEGIVVPPDAPTHHEKKGFFARLFGGDDVADERDEADTEPDPRDRRMRDITNPDDR